MVIIKNIQQLKQWRAAQVQSDIAFVPTMGALHAGHLSLIDAAKRNHQIIVASIFVNPLQFGANEDLSRYPRPFERDAELLREAGVTVLFSPQISELYPATFATQVRITNGLDKVLCGSHRAGHFDGVCTVVALLFVLVRPDAAFFGEKDFQQLAIIKRMNEDLHLIPQIIGVPTMREADGLAMSSRNQYLSEAERQIAPKLYQTLCAIKGQYQSLNELSGLLEWGKANIVKSGFNSVDYLELRSEADLQLTEIPQKARLFVAARLGNTRLIDNIAI
jgi:pantoate--beta-alanine ligase